MQSMENKTDKDDIIIETYYIFDIVTEIHNIF